MAGVRVEGLLKKFGNVTALDHVSLEFEDGQLTVLVGPSGCGKTTLLRIIAGLEDATGGSVFIGHEAVNQVPPWERNIAMVFQSYALYPHMTVFDNIAFPLRARKISKAEVKQRVEQTAALLGLSELLQRKPRQLSGGQMQRVALGRAIVRKPEVFLMDEPLSNLDAKLRVEMRAELKRLQKDLGVTTIYVTHDQAEAMTMADKLVVMRGGVIQQMGEPEEVYSHPRNTFVGGFIGSPAMNFIRCSVDCAEAELHAPDFQCKAPSRFVEALRRRGKDSVILGVRPEDLKVLASFEEGAVPATVYISEPMGKEMLLTVEVGGALAKAITPTNVRPRIGETVWLTFDEACVHLFDSETDEALPTE
ncbi:MAG: ABC transporter ATP-binding protein [Anaerolineae bacterium]|jgi:multiple sugar transport system ATP-binding protein|nr:ABC transporter ATP-binding protein [Anaerolineae bacterium]